MPSSTERAVLAGGCFWGMQDLIRAYPASSRRGSATPAATCPTRPIAITATTPRRSRSSSTRRRSATASCWSSSSRSTIPSTRNRQGNDIGRELPLGDLLHERRAEARREDTIADVDASGLWPGKAVTEVAPGRPVLGSRAGASGLSRALSERLHLPLRPPQLGSAQAGRRGIEGLGRAVLPPLRGKVARSAGWGVARRFYASRIAPTVAANLHRPRAAFHTPSAATRHLPRFAEKERVADRLQLDGLYECVARRERGRRLIPNRNCQDATEAAILVRRMPSRLGNASGGSDDDRQAFSLERLVSRRLGPARSAGR